VATMRQRPLVAVFAAVFAARRTLASPTIRLVLPLLLLYRTVASASRDEAFLLLEPERCEAGGCPELSAFWDEMTGHAPPGFVGRRACAAGDAAYLCAAAERRGELRDDMPAVVVRAADGSYLPYAGERSIEGIMSAVTAAAAGAPSPPGITNGGGDARTTSRGPPAGDDPIRCLERAYAEARSRGGNEVCLDAETCAARLRPADVARTRVYDNFTNASVAVATGEKAKVAEGAMSWPDKPAKRAGAPVNASFVVLPSVLSPVEVAAIRALTEDEALAFDEVPDSVDGMPSYEMFVFGKETPIDVTPERRRVRQRLSAIMQNALERRLTPYVRQRYAERCAGDRACTPCSSLIRRYREGERRSHAPHEDSEAFATVVVSLANAGDEFEGGLYLAASSSAEKRSLALQRGDAVVHRGDLLHGVDVKRGERWSWILWYRDSPTCEDHGREWYAECALTNPVCQALHAGHQDDPADAVALYSFAAANGLPRAMVKMARFHHGNGHCKGPGGPCHRMPRNLLAAAASYRDCVELWDDPDCNYGLAQMHLRNATLPNRAAVAVEAFEAAARHGHAFAAYNLGVAHLFGHGVLPNADLAAAWFEASGLPEGLLAASFGADSEDAAAALRSRATALGANAPWRAQARHLTGAGGTGGVALHSPWPGGSCAL